MQTNGNTPCDKSVVVALPGQYLGHVIPGTFFCVGGLWLCVEIGFRIRRRQQGQALGHGQALGGGASSPPPRLISALLASCILLACMVGVIIEADFTTGWWNTNTPDCFRNHANDTNRDALLRCSTYPLMGHLNRYGHSEHQTVYALFALPNVLSLLHRGASHLASSPGAPTLPNVSLERVGFVFAFFGSHVIWNNHASAMQMNPCWDPPSMDAMKMNMHWHLLLGQVNVFSAFVASISLIQKNLDPGVFIGAVMVWQGFTFWTVATATYSGGDTYGNGPNKGRWLPDPEKVARDSSMCVEVGEICEVSKLNLGVSEMKGHAVAVVLLCGVLALGCGGSLALVGWFLAGRCGGGGERRKPSAMQYEMVNRAADARSEGEEDAYQCQ